MNKMNTDLALKYLEFSPTQPLSTARLAIFLHGWGANEEDLADLSPALLTNYHVLVVRAPIVLGRKAFSWMPSARGAIQGEIPEASSSLGILKEFLRGAEKKYGVEPKNTFLLGFSQGAMMSLGVALTTPELIGGVVALSGRILPQDQKSAVKQTGSLAGFPIHLSHGTEDTVLPIALGRASRDFLQTLPVQLEYFEFPMGHDITEMNFAPVIQWFAKRAQ